MPENEARSRRGNITECTRNAGDFGCGGACVSSRTLHLPLQQK
jgi:hypothetical protein